MVFTAQNASNLRKDLTAETTLMAELTEKEHQIKRESHYMTDVALQQQQHQQQQQQRLIDKNLLSELALSEKVQNGSSTGEDTPPSLSAELEGEKLSRHSGSSMVTTGMEMYDNKIAVTTMICYGIEYMCKSYCDWSDTSVF